MAFCVLVNMDDLIDIGKESLIHAHQLFVTKYTCHPSIRPQAPKHAYGYKEEVPSILVPYSLCELDCKKNTIKQGFKDNESFHTLVSTNPIAFPKYQVITIGILFD